MRYGILLLLLAGCMVGPKYHPPEMGMPETFVEENDCITLDDADFKQWWKRLNDPLLSEFIEEAYSSNFDMRIALEMVIQARAEFQAEAAKLFPQFNLDAAAVRTRQSENIFRGVAAAETAGDGAVSPIQNFFQVGFDAIWEMDFFGKLRHARKAALYSYESLQDESQAIMLTVLSEVANNYVAIRAFQRLEELARQQVMIDEEELSLAKVRFEAGLSSQEEMLALLGQLDQDRATVAELHSTLRQSIYRFALLLGKTPESILPRFTNTSPIPVATGLVPAGLPSELLRRRPDIRGAERQIAAATEQIGVAVADLFPKVYLAATNLFAANPSGSNYGYGSSQLNTLFKPKSLTWSIGPGFSWPFLDFGRRRSVVKAQKAIQRQTLIAYEKTVINALREVESALIAYFQEEKQLALYQEEANAQAQIFELTSSRYEAGLVDYTQVLIAWNRWLLSEKSLASHTQALTSQFIGIYKALGGDWE